MFEREATSCYFRKTQGYRGLCLTNTIAAIQIPLWECLGDTVKNVVANTGFISERPEESHAAA